ncbi:MAG: hypothetical protein ACE5HJ_08225 [Thermoplasmata archaeon]
MRPAIWILIVAVASVLLSGGAVAQAQESSEHSPLLTQVMYWDLIVSFVVAALSAYLIYFTRRGKTAHAWGLIGVGGISQGVSEVIEFLEAFGSDTELVHHIFMALTVTFFALGIALHLRILKGMIR